MTGAEEPAAGAYTARTDLKKTDTARKTEIDVAKGLALFTVVLGHVVVLHGRVSNWILAFHMPAFFFLSGMTFRPERYDTWVQFLKDKWKKRILPYFIIVLTGFLICMLRPSYRQPVFQDGWRFQLTWILYYTQPINLYVGQAWFLVGLFFAELFAFIWLRLFGKRHLLVRCYSLLFLALAAVSVRRIDGFLPWGQRLPWKMDSGLCGAVFLLAGFGAARADLFSRLRPAALFLIPVCTWLSYWLGPKLFGYVNICDCVYSPAPYYYGAAFMGIAALVLTAVLLRNSRFWQFAGRLTLPLFAMQTFAIYLVIEAVEKITGMAYMPMELMPGTKECLLIAAAAFGLMLLAVLPWYFYKREKLHKKYRTK